MTEEEEEEEYVMQAYGDIYTGLLFFRTWLC